MRGKGWKFGSGFVDGIFPVLSPTAEKILEYLQKEIDTERIWGSLDKLPPSLDAWDDVLSVSVQLRMRKHWDSIISVRNIKSYKLYLFFLVHKLQTLSYL